MVGSQMQVPVAIERFERYAKAALRDFTIPLPPIADADDAAGDRRADRRHRCNRQPVGVVACISPYNFPVVNIAGKIAPALAVGCTVVIKPAPQDPLAVIELVEIMHEVGFPPGVVNVVTSSRPEPAAALTETRDIDMISFTGSTTVGQRIFEAGGKSMKRLLLELGGKGAAIVARRRRPVEGGRRPRPACGASTPDRSAPPRRGPSCTAAATTSWCRRWPRRHRR